MPDVPNLNHVAMSGISQPFPAGTWTNIQYNTLHKAKVAVAKPWQNQSLASTDCV